MTASIIQSADPIKHEHDLVVRKVEDELGASYTILSNLEKAQHQIGSFFPDLILTDKISNRPQFIIEVRRNGNIARCLQQWKSLNDIPAFLFLVVPEQDIQNAKEVSQVLGMQIGLGCYTVKDNNVTIDFNPK